MKNISALDLLVIFCSTILFSCSSNTAATDPNASLVSIAIAPDAPSLTWGTAQQFTATGTFSDSSSRDMTASVLWSSSSTSIALISNETGSQGTATLVSAGTTTITASSGGISTSTALIVTPRLMGGASQGKSLDLTAAVSTIAGVAPGTGDGVGAAARFLFPSGVTSDGTNLYTVDANGTIRKIVIATGEVSTLGSATGLPGIYQVYQGYVPTYDLATDGINLYIASSYNIIQKLVLATGVTTTLAGSYGSSGYADGIGSDARFSMPRGITTDGTNLFVADSLNNTIRKIVIATGAVTTLAGQANSMGASDGPGSTATFSRPIDIATDGVNVYVSDYYNHIVRKIVISTTEVSTIAGIAEFPGSANGTGTAAQFNGPAGIVIRGTDLYVIDGNNRTLRKIAISTGEVTTVAGTPGAMGSLDGTAAAAQFRSPFDLASIGDSLYIVDRGNCTIRKLVVATGAVSTLAGSASTGSSDGNGTAARFSQPDGVTTDGINLYVADTMNSVIRKIILSTGEVSLFAGTAGTSGAADGIGAAARFNRPSGITTDGTSLYITDRADHTIRKITLDSGEVTTLAGTAGVSGSADGTGPTTLFKNPHGITTDGTNVYVVDSGNSTIRRIVISSGNVTTMAGTAGASGTVDGTGAAALFNYPAGITTDGSDLYVTDFLNCTVRRIAISSALVTTVAGTAGASGFIDGTGASARFLAPTGITNDGVNLYVADQGNNSVRKIIISTGEVSTVAGTALYAGALDGTGSAAWFHMPTGITTDGHSLYVTDTQNSTIRKIQ